MTGIVNVNPTAVEVQARHCESCYNQHDTNRLRDVTEGGTTESARRFLCAHCAGGMKTLGHSVAPFTRVDANEYARWLTAPTVDPRSVPSMRLWSTTEAF